MFEDTPALLVKLREETLDGMCTLGQWYFADGNVEEALRWLNAAADLGSRDATVTLEKIRRDGTSGVQSEGKKIRRHFTKTKINFSSCGTKFLREEIHRDGEKTVDYLIETAANYPDMYIEKIYSDGQDVPMTSEEHAYYFDNLDEVGDDDAKFALGCMYLYGQNVERNIYKAAWWFAKIDELYRFNINVIFELAECYRKGKGIERDIYKAVAWYRKFVELASTLVTKFGSRSPKIIFTATAALNKIYTQPCQNRNLRRLSNGR